MAIFYVFILDNQFYTNHSSGFISISFCLFLRTFSNIVYFTLSLFFMANLLNFYQISPILLFLILSPISHHGRMPHHRPRLDSTQSKDSLVFPNPSGQAFFHPEPLRHLRINQFIHNERAISSGKYAFLKSLIQKIKLSSKLKDLLLR